jgi:hypothetical protein
LRVCTDRRNHSNVSSWRSSIVCPSNSDAKLVSVFENSSVASRWNQPGPRSLGKLGMGFDDLLPSVIGIKRRDNGYGDGGYSLDLSAMLIPPRVLGVCALFFGVCIIVGACLLLALSLSGNSALLIVCRLVLVASIYWLGSQCIHYALSILDPLFEPPALGDRFDVPKLSVDSQLEERGD